MDDILVAGGDDVAAEGSFEAIGTNGDEHCRRIIDTDGIKRQIEVMREQLVSRPSCR